MLELLQEFCDWRGMALRVDGQAGVIHGVKILIIMTLHPDT